MLTTEPAPATPDARVRALFAQAAVLNPLASDPPLKAPEARRSRHLRTIDFAQLLELDLPPRAPLLGPWLMEQSLNMVHAKRGTGKTHFTIGTAFAVATGTSFLRWAAPAARRVLFVDGELPARVLQDRLAEARRRTGVSPAPGFLTIITPDLLNRAAPDLATLSDQAELDEVIAGHDLVILDNLSCLVRSGAAENDAESWVTVSDWALRHRAAGRSILFVHHSGKSGAQRGTSRREDLLDVVVSLRQPADYDPAEGARFEVHFEKARHLAGRDVAAFEVALDDAAPGGWSVQSLEDNVDAQIVDRMALGLSMADIGRELNLHKSNISRRVRELKTRGVLPQDGSAPKVRNTQRNGRQRPIELAP